MTEAELVEQWTPLARMYAGRMSNELEWEDKISAAMEGVLYGVRTYLALDNPPFAVGTYIQWRMRREISHARARHERQYVPPTLGATGDGDGWAVGMELEWNMTPIRIGTVMQRDVARLLARGLTQTDIGEKMGVSRQRIHQIVNELRELNEGTSTGNGGGGE
jgi:DNA-directed RNA polymerase specialized sigma subunit